MTGSMSQTAPPAERALPTVSVVMPAYNAADTIKRALDSVYAQTYANIIEVIVVDDGSADNTAEIVRDSFPNATLIQQANGGASVARNAGIECATGDLIAFLDADDEWFPEKTEVHVGVMRDNPGLALCMCDSVSPDARDTRTNPGVPLLRHITCRGAVLRQEGMLCGCSVWLARREVIARIQFDPRVRRVEDLELIVRLAALGYTVAFCTLRLSVYYGSWNRLQREAITTGFAEVTLFVGQKQFGEGNRVSHGWLTPEEARNMWVKRQRVAVDILCLTGEDARANGLARNALSEKGGILADRLRLWFMAHTPSIYGTLRRSLFQTMRR